MHTTDRKTATKSIEHTAIKIPKFLLSHTIGRHVLICALYIFQACSNLTIFTQKYIEANDVSPQQLPYCKLCFLPFLLISSWIPDQQCMILCYFWELFSYTLKVIWHWCVLFWIWVLFENNALDKNLKMKLLNFKCIFGHKQKH